MNKRFLTILLLLLLVVASCSSLQYHRTLRRWTRQHDVYSIETLNARVLWHATYLSPEYRATARAKINEWKKLEPGEMTNYVDYLMSNETGSFLVSIYTPKGFPSLKSDSDSFWEFTLNLPTGEALMPTSIESVKLTPREYRLFPYVNRWSQFYWVKFPVGSLNMPFTLSLRSAGATSFLDW